MIFFTCILGYAIASVEVVSKVILEAVTSKNPNLRYLTGKDVETWAANKKTMSDIEFFHSINNLAR
jgi:hypothetical protein